MSALEIERLDMIIRIRTQMHQLEMTMRYGGPSEICGAIDAVDSALNGLRSIVCPNNSMASDSAVAPPCNPETVDVTK